jgi:hypothetical protein
MATSFSLADGGTIGIGGAKWTFDDTNDDISTTAKIGIGTTSPITPLHIHRNDSGGDFILLTTNSTGQVNNQDGFRIGNDGTNIYMWNAENTDIRFGTNGIDRIRIKNSGNVGIGTTSPETVLHVKSSTTDATGDLGAYSSAAITITNSDNDDWRMGVNGNADFTFWFDLADRAHLKDTVAAGELDFTGQHRSLMNNNISSSSVGLIVSSTNNYINTDNSVNPKINESLPFCVITSTANDKKVFGVISDKEDTETNREFGMGTFVSVFAKHNTNEQRLHINSVGEGGMWISNKNGSLEGGDYITSTTVIGYGGKQSDDILHNYTVAKITCDCNFSLTKIVKHKLKVSQTVEGQNIDYDVNGDVQYENDLDTSGNQQMVYPLETRFLQSDGTQLTDETDYTTRLAAGESVYIACFVGCTYHCG